jgi:hypothetical protein
MHISSGDIMIYDEDHGAPYWIAANDNLVGFGAFCGSVVECCKCFFWHMG